MFAVTGVICQDVNAEILKNCIEWVFHPVHERDHTDRGRHTAPEDTHAAEITGKNIIVTNAGRITLSSNCNVKTFTAEAKDCGQCKRVCKMKCY